MSNEQQHTPEPWLVTSYEGGWTGIGSNMHGILFKVAYNNDENAVRAVACVNACSGIPTDALAPGSVAALVAAAERYMDASSHTFPGNFEYTVGDARKMLQEALALFKEVR